MLRPEISVVIPVKNGEATIRDCLNSILCQKGVEFEVIIIDDHSRDNTINVIESFQKNNNRIHLIHATEYGITPNLNLGISRAKADLIARMDADDIMKPDRLFAQFERFVKHPELVCTCTRAEFMGSKSGLAGKSLTHNQIKDKLRKHNCLIHPAACFRKSVFTSIGGYRNIFPYAQDYDLWLRMSDRGKMEMTDNIGIFYRVSESQVSSKKAVLQSTISFIISWRYRCGTLEKIKSNGLTHFERTSNSFSRLMSIAVLKTILSAHLHSHIAPENQIAMIRAYKSFFQHVSQLIVIKRFLLAYEYRFLRSSNNHFKLIAFARLVHYAFRLPVRRWLFHVKRLLSCALFVHC
ncbi:glycosyltransferase family 2 protein [Acidihalobacter prosperus]